MAEQSLEGILNAFIEDAEAVSTQMTVEDKQRVTKAGADVFAKELESEYKANHYRHRKTGKDPHLADFRTAWSAFQDTVFAEADKVANTVAE